VAFEVSEGKPLEVMIGPHPQIVGYPLADALGEVVIDIGCERPQNGYKYGRKAAKAAICILPSAANVVGEPKNRSSQRGR
jgi:hypothetical protein